MSWDVRERLRERWAADPFFSELCCEKWLVEIRDADDRTPLIDTPGYEKERHLLVNWPDRPYTVGEWRANLRRSRAEIARL